MRHLLFALATLAAVLASTTEDNPSWEGQCSVTRCGYLCSSDECRPEPRCKGPTPACLRDALVVLNENRTTPRLYDRCAVVSSSDVLLEDRFGTEIDSHDAIFRINFSPVVSLETFVGSSTRVAMTNAPSWGFGKYDRIINSKRFVEDVRTQLGLNDPKTPKEEQTIRIIIQDPLMAIDDWKCCYPNSSHRMRPRLQEVYKRCVKAFNKVPGATCEVLDYDYANTAWRSVCAIHNGQCPMGPSSGLITMIYAHTACRSIRLFGFDLLSNTYTGHYFAPNRHVEHELHPSIEHALIQAWNQSLPDDVFSIATSSKSSSSLTTTTTKCGESRR